MQIIDWILARLSENSTWRGIFALLTALGVTISPEHANAIIAGGLTVIGSINVIRKGPNQSQPPTTTTVTTPTP